MGSPLTAYRRSRLSRRSRRLRGVGRASPRPRVSIVVLFLAYELVALARCACGLWRREKLEQGFYHRQRRARETRRSETRPIPTTIQRLTRLRSSARGHTRVRGSPRGSDRDAGQVVGRRLASSNAAEGDATEARRSRRIYGAARAVELRREVVQPFKSTRPARGLSSGSQPKGRSGCARFDRSRKYAPLQSTLTGKTEPVGRRRRAPAPEEEARNDRGVSARANPARSWGAAANAAPVGALLGEGCCFIRLQSKNTPLGVQRDKLF